MFEITAYKSSELRVHQRQMWETDAFKAPIQRKYYLLLLFPLAKHRPKKFLLQNPFICRYRKAAESTKEMMEESVKPNAKIKTAKGDNFNQNIFQQK